MKHAPSIFHYIGDECGTGEWKGEKVWGTFSREPFWEAIPLLQSPVEESTERSDG